MSMMVAPSLLGAGGGSPPMTAAANPATVYGSAATTATVTIVSGETVVSVSGGTGPFTYLWTLLSSDGGTWSIGHATLAATQFVCSGVADGNTFSANFRCQVTAANGAVVNSNTVTASVTNYGSYA